MPSIDLTFEILKTSNSYIFYTYSIKNNTSFFKEINNQILVLNNRNYDLENEIYQNKNLQELSFPVLIQSNQNNLNISSISISFFVNKNYKQYYKTYVLKLKIYKDKGKIFFYLIFEDNRKDIKAEYVSIIPIKNKIKFEKTKEIELEIIKKKKLDSNNENIQANEEIKKKEGKKNNKRPSSKFIIESIDSKIINLKNKLMQSKIGLENPKATCYLASIIQTFMHTESFLNIFLKNKNDKGISYILYNLFLKISEITNKKTIPIKDFAESLNKIDNRYNLKEVNNPILFITHLLEHLDKENKNKVTPLFKGKKQIIFEKNTEMNDKEEFLIYLIQINEKSDISSINKLLTIKTIIDMEYDFDIMIEKIIEAPPILIINIDELDNRGIKIEHEITVCDFKYMLYAINSYNNFHSTV